MSLFFPLTLVPRVGHICPPPLCTVSVACIVPVVGGVPHCGRVPAVPPSVPRVVLPAGGGGGLLGRIHATVLEGGDRAGDCRAVGVAVEPQWFCHRCWGRGGGLGLISGVMQEDLPVTVPRVEVHAIAPAHLGVLRLALRQLGLVAGLVSVSVCVGSLLWRDFGCPGLRLLLGCSADSCHKVRKGRHCPQGLGEFALGAVFPGLFPAAVAVTVTVTGAVGIRVPA